MKKLLGYVAVGTVGYLVGFYEMKYKTMKSLNMMLQTALKDYSKEEES